MNLLRIAARVSFAAGRVCGQCGADDGPGERELRPYGPGGSLICFGCATGTSEAEEQARQEFQGRLDDAGPVAILTPDGPEAI